MKEVHCASHKLTNKQQLLSSDPIIHFLINLFVRCEYYTSHYGHTGKQGNISQQDLYHGQLTLFLLLENDIFRLFMSQKDYYCVLERSKFLWCDLISTFSIQVLMVLGESLCHSRQLITLPSSSCLLVPKLCTQVILVQEGF